MSRTGVEAKPAWGTVPAGVRERVSEALGAPVVRGVRVWGGYSPTPTFRLLLADGRRAFFKGTNASSDAFPRHALLQEERFYREVSPLIGAYVPAFYGACWHEDDWHVLLLEDVGPRTMPPWQPATTRRLAHAYAGFHASTLGADLPDWMLRPQQSMPRVSWEAIAEESDGLREIASLARGHSRAALSWLRTALPLLSRLADATAAAPGPYALLHSDTRSDNLRFRGERLVLFDWPFAEAGRPELDVAAFAQTVTVEGGVDPETFVGWYAERLPLDADALDAAIAWMIAFFAGIAWRPDLPGLPRLRRFQRQQLAVLVAWGARRLRLPEPTWIAALDL
jgi:hypothetical protein